MFYCAAHPRQMLSPPHFDAGQFVEAWDDEAARKGYCLYKMGCKGRHRRREPSRSDSAAVGSMVR